MIDAGWFFDVALKSSAIAALTLLAVRLLRQRSAAERSSVLHGGLFAMALLPLLTAVAPRWQVELPAMLAPTPTLVVPATTAPTQGEGAAQVDTTMPGATASLPIRAVDQSARRIEGADRAVRATAPAASAAWRIDAANVWGVLYSLPALALLFALGMSLSALYALRDRSLPLRDARWDDALRSAQRRSGVRGRIELLHSPETSSPLSWGVRRRLIVLDADSIEPATAQALLAHELAHLARHDWLKLIFGRVVTALLWFNPLVWILARRCHQLREEAADDAVLRGEVAGVDYAELLLNFARNGAPQPALAAHAIFSGRGAMQHLSQRLERVLDDGERRAPAMRTWSFGCALAALALAMSLAAFTPMVAPATASNTASPPAPTALAPLSSLAPLAPLPSLAPLTGATGALTAASAADDVRLTFTLGPRRHGQAGELQVSFEEESSHGRGMHSSGLPIASLQGLSESTLTAEQPQVVDFSIVRAAGTLQCQGSARRGIASGTCSFAPDARFAAELGRRGVGSVSAREQLQLTLQDARLDVLDELARQGYETPNVKRYVEMSIHDVDVAWLRGLQSLGLKLDSLARLVEFRIHDIDAAYIGDLKAAGYGDLSPRQLVEFRVHDVTGEAVAELAAAGFVDLPPKQLLAMRIHEVTPAFVREMKSIGYGDLSAERLVEFSIHEVTPAFVREMDAAGYRNLPASRLVQFRIHDVTAEFIREVNELGYRNVDADDLITMRVHDVTPSWIRARLADAGKTPPSIDQLVGWRIHGE